MGIRGIFGPIREKLWPSHRRSVDYDPAAWQRLDDSWDNNFTQVGWAEFRLNIVDWVMSIRDDHETVLDLACHIGHFIDRLRRQGYDREYLGVDITPRFIERARELLPDERFEIGDVRDLPFPDKSFDLVMCVGVLMHLPDVKEPLHHVFRIARKYVLLSTYGSRGETYTRHDAKGNFMNSYYSKSDIMAQVPPDWKLIDYKEFERTDIPRHNLIFQFLLKHES